MGALGVARTHPSDGTLPDPGRRSTASLAGNLRERMVAVPCRQRGIGGAEHNRRCLLTCSKRRHGAGHDPRRLRHRHSRAARTFDGVERCGAQCSPVRRSPSSKCPRPGAAIVLMVAHKAGGVVTPTTPNVRCNFQIGEPSKATSRVFIWEQVGSLESVNARALNRLNLL